MSATRVEAIDHESAAAGGLAALVSEQTRRIVDSRRKGTHLRRRGWLVRRMLLAADVAGLVGAFLLTTVVLGELPTTHPWKLGALLASLPIWVLAAKIYGLYDRDEECADRSTLDDAVDVFHLVTVGVWLVFFVSWATDASRLSPSKLATFWVAAILSIAAARSIARTAARRSVYFLQNTVIVGAGEVGQLIARKVMHHPEYGINLVGFVDDHPRDRRPGLEHVALLGGTDSLQDIVELLDVDRVVVAFSQASAPETISLIRSLRDYDVQVDIVPRLFDVVGPRVTHHAFEALPLIGLPPVRLPRSSRLVKRLLDIVGAGFLLVVTGPLLLGIALWIRLDSRGPALFRQVRLGLMMKEFTLLKFRTMRCDVDDSEHREYIRTTMSADATANGNGVFKLDRGDAITRAGRWLRRTSLDELPQLINVLRGEMSLVGPRPCISYETEHFQPRHFERFLVPPGLTGLWQVTARAHATFGEALDMDVAYARGWSLKLDLSLLLQTPRQVLRQKSGGTA
jgi:exopolysaccharide biosynthesis polyprenyl glycosylphosphotransferase